MSTKIYEGLRLADPSTSLFDAVAVLSVAVTAHFNTQRRAVVAEEIVQVVDRGDRGDDRCMVFDDARTRWLEQQNKLGHHHTLSDPLRFTIVFGQASSGRTLALPFYLHSAGYGDILAGTGLFHEYGYWNNTDRPSEASKKEWAARRDDWDSILNDDGTFAHLPLWQLDSMHNTFSYDVLFHTTTTVDEFVTPRDRLKRTLAEALIQSRGPIGKSDIFRVYSVDDRLARQHVDTLPDESPLIPAPIGGFAVKYGDLPKRLPVPEDVIRAAREFGERQSPDY